MSKNDTEKKFIFRRLNEKDKEEFTAIASQEEIRNGTGRRLESEELFITAMEQTDAFAMILNGKLIGYGMLFTSTLTDLPGGLKAFEAAYTIAPEYQGRGCGGLLLDYLSAEAKDSEAAVLLAGAYGDNCSGTKLLLSRGFKYIFSRTDICDGISREEKIYFKEI